MTLFAAPSPVGPTQATHPFYRATRSFRTPKVIIMVAAAGYFWWIVSLPHTPHTARNHLPIKLAWIFSIIAAMGLYRVFVGGVWELLINTDGIRYHNQLWHWSDIQRISSSRVSFASTYNLSIVVAGGKCFHLPSDQPMSQQDMSAVLSQLRAWLQIYHPHVEVQGE